MSFKDIHPSLLVAPVIKKELQVTSQLSKTISHKSYHSPPILYWKKSLLNLPPVALQI
jgi:hypothetical protein